MTDPGVNPLHVAIWWIRRDLRLSANRALAAALGAATQVIPLFIIDDRLLTSPYAAATRTGFLTGGLAALDATLRACGSYLVVRQGEPGSVLAALIEELRGTHQATYVRIFAEADVSPFARRRDDAIARNLPITFVNGVTVLPIDSVCKADGSAYTVFAPYSKRWKDAIEHSDFLTEYGNGQLPTPTRIRTPAGIRSESRVAWMQPAGNVVFPPGEVEANRRLNVFTMGEDAPIFRYAEQRDRPDLDGTSQLSPYLRFGMLSPRQAASAAVAAVRAAADDRSRQGAKTWMGELIWRDFYLTILSRFPHVRQGSFRPDYDRIPWRNNESEFAAWCEGRTGYPFIDAAMRQLQSIGWMHNRARMAVASFLVKDLLIDWRWGERWFMQHLVDGDPAANNGGWQWAAGTGTDAAPYFRIFNPTNQGVKFDPVGAYVRRWVPELAAVPTKSIHEPWRLTTADQTRARCRIGIDYPAPIVNHQEARTRTLDAYRQAVR